MAARKRQKYKVFHEVTAQIMKRNKIHNLDKNGGGICKGDQEVAQEREEYFKNIFTTSGLLGGVDILDGIQRNISDSMNVLLTSPVEDKKIKEALFLMSPHKGPNLDGMSPHFFQTYWPILGTNFCNTIKVFFFNMNHTLIALIHKVKNVLNITEFRPISL